MNKSKILLAVVFGIFSIMIFAQGYEEQGQELPENEFKWPDGKKLAISLSFDDARLSQADKGFAVLDKYGVKASFYVSPDPLLLRLDAWQAAVENGHDIGNHSLLHSCTGNYSWSRHKALEDYTLERMSFELDSASRIIEEALGITPVSFGYPCGQTYIGRGLKTKSYVPLISAMFATGRTWLDEGPNDPGYCDLAQLTGMELDGKNFEQILSLIESSRETGSWLILAGHEIPPGQGVFKNDRYHPTLTRDALFCKAGPNFPPTHLG